MPSSRSQGLVESLLDDLESRAVTPGECLLVIDEIERVGRKWAAKAERGEKKRTSDFALLDRWRRRWVTVAEGVGDAGVAAKVEVVRGAIRD